LRDEILLNIRAKRGSNAKIAPLLRAATNFPYARSEACVIGYVIVNPSFWTAHRVKIIPHYARVELTIMIKRSAMLAVISI